jgi:regulation of enolase protein 1 (concanavalin A-like superfamily)
LYQVVQGDASLTARLLSINGGNQEWARIGLMVRENDTPGSPHLHYHVTSNSVAGKKHGLAVFARLEQDRQTFNLGEVGPTVNLDPTQIDLYIRLQRVQNDIAGFYSSDGQLWFQARFPPVTLPSLNQAALFGLTDTAHDDGTVTTGKVDKVVLEQGGTSVYGISACGFDKAVMIEWRALPNAVSYNLYRVPAGATRSQLVPLNTNPIAGTIYTDMSPGLIDGTPVTYAVAAVFNGSDGNPVEGSPVAIEAAPAATPPGWSACSVNSLLKDSNTGEIRQSGSVAYDAATGMITLGGSGSGVAIYNNPAPTAVTATSHSWDEFYFLGQTVDGDARITAQVIAPPTTSGTPNKGMAGLMIRESLDASARDSAMLRTDTTLDSTVRPVTNGSGPVPPMHLLTNLGAQPFVLRITRKGNTITQEYSQDEGKTFVSATSLTFDPPLPKTLYVGLAVSAGQRTQTASAQFKDVQIEKP